MNINSDNSGTDVRPFEAIRAKTGAQTFSVWSRTFNV